MTKTTNRYTATATGAVVDRNTGVRIIPGGTLNVRAAIRIAQMMNQGVAL